MKDEVSLMSLHPAVQHFVFSAIRYISKEKFNYEEKIVIDADLVPKVVNKVMKPSVNIHIPVVKKPKPRPIKKIIKAPVVPVKRQPPVQVKKQVAPPVAPKIVADGAVDEGGEYGKISSLLNDPSVSTIECMGEGTPLMVVRMGQKQKTRIVLNTNQIKDILNKVADAAHIPLLDGVFRAVIKGFSINAVVSDMIGSRFVIKKAATF